VTSWPAPGAFAHKCRCDDRETQIGRSGVSGTQVRGSERPPILRKFGKTATWLLETDSLLPHSDEWKYWQLIREGCYTPLSGDEPFCFIHCHRCYPGGRSAPLCPSTLPAR